MVYSESLNGRMYIRGKALSKGCVTIISHLKQEGAYETTGELPRGAIGRVANILKIDKNCVSRHNKWLTNKNRRSLPKGGSENSWWADDVSICMLQYPMHFSSFYLPVFYISKPSTSAMINQPWNSLKRRFAFTWTIDHSACRSPAASTTDYRPNRRLRAPSLQFAVLYSMIFI